MIYECVVDGYTEDTKERRTFMMEASHLGEAMAKARGVGESICTFGAPWKGFEVMSARPATFPCESAIVQRWSLKTGKPTAYCK